MISYIQELKLHTNLSPFWSELLLMMALKEVDVNANFNFLLISALAITATPPPFIRENTTWPRSWLSYIISKQGLTDTAVKCTRVRRRFPFSIIVIKVCWSLGGLGQTILGANLPYCRGYKWFDVTLIGCDRGSECRSRADKNRGLWF